MANKGKNPEKVEVFQGAALGYRTTDVDFFFVESVDESFLEHLVTSNYIAYEKLLFVQSATEEQLTRAVKSKAFGLYVIDRQVKTLNLWPFVPGFERFLRKHGLEFALYELSDEPTGSQQE